MDSAVFQTPLGWAGVAASEKGITRIILPRVNRQAVLRDLRQIKRAKSGMRKAEESPAVLRDSLSNAVAFLREYFSGKRVLFDLPLDIGYYTKFQQAVWRAARGIPCGETRSYGWIAQRIGRPRSARAVGQALGANPVPVIIPCHRVLASSGGLCGFSGGLGMKRKLLDLERIHHGDTDVMIKK